MQKMRILVTNDDGIHAPGIRALVKALAESATILVAAPDRERSAMGHAITMNQPLRAEKTEFAGVAEAYAISGTPADCVKLAVERLFAGRIDLVVSGINRGANLGTDVLYSGTVSAALEGVILGLPAIAFSLAEYADPDFTTAARLADYLVNAVWAKRWPADTLLNVNFPGSGFAHPKGLRVTTLGQRKYDNPVKERQDPWGGTYYWLAGDIRPSGCGEETDVGAVENGYVSMTPIHFDLTDYKLLETIDEWGLQLPK